MIEWLSKFWTLTYLETQHALLSENKTENERVWGAAEEKIACESIRFFRLKFLVLPAGCSRRLKIIEQKKNRLIAGYYNCATGDNDKTNINRNINKHIQTV